jgi:hypothetical protein
MHFYGIWSHFEAFRGGLNKLGGSFSKKSLLGGKEGWAPFFNWCGEY